MRRSARAHAHLHNLVHARESMSRRRLVALFGCHRCQMTASLPSPQVVGPVASRFDGGSQRQRIPAMSLGRHTESGLRRPYCNQAPTARSVIVRASQRSLARAARLRPPGPHYAWPELTIVVGAYTASAEPRGGRAAYSEAPQAPTSAVLVYLRTALLSKARAQRG